MEERERQVLNLKRSRLASCVRLKDTDITMEFPKHTRNHAREH